MRHISSFFYAGFARVALLALAVLVAGCSGSLEALGAPTATPTATATATPTPIPSATPTPTPSPTPTPTWQRTQTLIPPTGRQFQAGWLSPDGAYLALLSQPETAPGEEWDYDPMLHIMDANTMQPVWVGKPETRRPFQWAEYVTWVPNSPYLLLEGTASTYMMLALIRVTDGEVLWQRSWPHEGFGLRYSAYDVRTQTLLVRARSGEYLQAYKVPAMEPVARYMAAETRQGCCLFHDIYGDDEHLVALGWERYGGRYHLIVWGTDDPAGRTLRLPYNWNDTSLTNLVWGPQDEIATLLVPATGSSSDVYTFLFIDPTTGNVRWSMTERETFSVAATWLDGHGWLIADFNGGVRLYTQPERYETLRVPTPSDMVYSLTSTWDGSRWLLVLGSQAELWAWR